jgi:hypothetical protein
VKPIPLGDELHTRPLGVDAPSKSRIEVVHVEARALYNIREDDAFWSATEADAYVPDVRGALVKVQPPADASDMSLVQLERRLRDRGATEVRFLPRPRQQSIGAAAQVRGSHKAVRAVVEQMVVEAPTKDRGALREVVGEALDGAGL